MTTPYYKVKLRTTKYSYVLQGTLVLVHKVQNTTKYFYVGTTPVLLRTTR